MFWKFNVHVDRKRVAGAKGNGLNFLWVGTQTRPQSIPATPMHHGNKEGFQDAEGMRGTIGRLSFNGLGWRVN
jgi:hypothetical protein